jgi:hypothetical protein
VLAGIPRRSSPSLEVFGGKPPRRQVNFTSVGFDILKMINLLEGLAFFFFRVE